eukprot:UN10405
MLMEIPYSSFAARCGLKAGDLVLEIDGVKMQNVEQLKDFKFHANQPLNIVIRRDEMVGEINL